MSEKQLAANRANAQKSTGPRTEEGKTAASRNAWKHGRYSAVARAHFKSGSESMAQMFGKPCKTSCPWHPQNPDGTEKPCALVLDGLTRAGGSCLDKTVYVNAFASLMSAMEKGDMEGAHGLMAAEGAAALQVLNQIRDELSTRGLMIPIYARTKEGQLLRDEEGAKIIDDFKMNPLLPQLITMLDRLGINLPEMLASPAARAKAKIGEEAADAMQTLLGGIMNRAGAPPPRGGRVLPPGGE